YLTIAKALEKIRISSATMRVLQLCLFLCVLCSAVLARPPPMERPYSAGTQGAGDGKIIVCMDSPLQTVTDRPPLTPPSWPRPGRRTD
ncbi:hypothetical protein BOX15_Mlig023984g2, partial [Macrostomum lignano]